MQYLILQIIYNKHFIIYVYTNKIKINEYNFRKFVYTSIYFLKHYADL